MGRLVLWGRAYLDYSLRVMLSAYDLEEAHLDSLRKLGKANQASSQCHQDDHDHYHDLPWYGNDDDQWPLIHC